MMLYLYRSGMSIPRTDKRLPEEILLFRGAPYMRTYIHMMLTSQSVQMRATEALS